MRKVMGILAVALMSMGLFSCEADNTDQALYETEAGGGTSNPTDGRE